jgi:hypothetical protein
MIIVVTREKSLVTYLLEIGLIEEGNYKIFEKVRPSDIRGKDVIGSLPFFLACAANTITEIPLKKTEDMKIKGSLTLTDIRQIAGEPQTYVVERLEDREN